MKTIEYNEVELKWFLLVFSKIKQKLIISDEYSDYREAMKYYNESERKYFRNNLYEVVLIGSKDLDTIKNTHGHYFPEELLKTGDSYNKKIAALSKY